MDITRYREDTYFSKPSNIIFINYNYHNNNGVYYIIHVVNIQYTVVYYKLNFIPINSSRF